MNGQISRRRFILSSAATALLFSNPFPVFGYDGSSAVDKQKVNLLIGENELARCIEKYLPHANSVASAAHHSIADLPALRHWINYSSGQRLLGAVGSDLYPILETLIREAGGAQLFHGRHMVTAKGWSRHQFYTVPRTQGAAQYFVASLGSTSGVCQADELCIGADATIEDEYRSVTFKPDWLAVVADMLVGIADGNWHPGPVNQYSLEPGIERPRAVAGAMGIAGIETFVFQL